jgi:hypothetical protein
VAAVATVAVATAPQRLPPLAYVHEFTYSRIITPHHNAGGRDRSEAVCGQRPLCGINLLQPIVNGSAPLLWQIHLAKERSVAGVRLEVF